MADTKKTDHTAPAAPTMGSFGTIQYTFDERKFLQDELQAKMPTEHIATRQGPSNTTVHYIETWRAIDIANKTFGFNGWSSSIVEISQDFVDQLPSGRFNVGYSAIVRITLKDGAFHEDVGYGASDNQKAKGQAIDNAKKKAVSDALKRALRNFGNALGLTVYDRDHIKSLGRQTTKKKTNEAPKVNPYFSQTVPSSSMLPGTTQAAPSQVDISQTSTTTAPPHKILDEDDAINWPETDETTLDVASPEPKSDDTTMQESTVSTPTSNNAAPVQQTAAKMSPPAAPKLPMPVASPPTAPKVKAPPPAPKPTSTAPPLANNANKTAPPLPPKTTAPPPAPSLKRTAEQMGADTSAEPANKKPRV